MTVWGGGKPWESYSQEACWEKVSFLGIEGVTQPAGLGAEGGRQMVGFLRMCGQKMGIGARVAGNIFLKKFFFNVYF